MFKTMKTNWRNKDYSLEIKINKMNEDQIRKRINKLEDIIDPTPAQNEEYELLQKRLDIFCDSYFK